MKRAMLLTRLVLPVALVMTIVSVAAPAQFDEHERWVYYPELEPAFLIYGNYTKPQAKQMMKLWNELGERNSAARLAGDYVNARELAAVIFRYDPDVGYVRLTVHSCMPHVQRFDFGAVKDTGDLLEVTPAAGLGRPYKLVKIAWGARRYLVEEDLVPGFCAYASGRQVHPKYGYATHEFFLNHPDGDNRVEGLPQLPAKYSRLELHPIEATVIRTEQKPDGIGGVTFTVWLNAGAKAGVRREMTFYRDGVEYNDLRVKKVGPDWCIAVNDVHYLHVEKNVMITRPELLEAGARWTTCSACVDRYIDR